MTEQQIIPLILSIICVYLSVSVLNKIQKFLFQIPGDQGEPLTRWEIYVRFAFACIFLIMAIITFVLFIRAS